jgi:4'-phosphopantetheinyl transferase
LSAPAHSTEARVETAWIQTSAVPAAEADRVDVWLVPLDAGRDAAEAFERLLDARERETAGNLHAERGRYVARRAALRLLIGRYLGTPAARVSLRLTTAGQPVLAEGAALDLRFSLSSRGDLALIAVGLGRAVGVDIERVRDDVAVDEVAGTILGPTAHAELAALPIGARRDAFFRAWVRHEALVKAAGRGIEIASGDAPHPGLSVRELPALPGHVAAVAAEGGDWWLSCRRLGGVAELSEHGSPGGTAPPSAHPGS